MLTTLSNIIFMIHRSCTSPSKREKEACQYMIQKDAHYIVEWYSQENDPIQCNVEAVSWRDALFCVCDHPPVAA